MASLPAIFGPVKGLVGSPGLPSVFSTFLLLSVLSGVLTHLGAAVFPSRFLPVLPDSCVRLRIAVNPLPFFKFVVYPCSAVIALKPFFASEFRKLALIIPEIPDVVGMPAIFFSRNFVFVGHPPSVTGFVMPPAVSCFPAILPRKSRPVMRVDIHMMVVPIKIGPGSE